jgi:hypothetical protein
LAAYERTHARNRGSGRLKPIAGKKGHALDSIDFAEMSNLTLLLLLFAGWATGGKTLASWHCVSIIPIKNCVFAAANALHRLHSYSYS